MDLPKIICEAVFYSLLEPLAVDWEEVTLPCLVLKTEDEELVVERVREERECQLVASLAIYKHATHIQGQGRDKQG